MVMWAAADLSVMGVREGVEDLSVMRVRVGVARLKCAIYRRYTEFKRYGR